jgi:hypothetical protein
VAREPGLHQEPPPSASESQPPRKWLRPPAAGKHLGDLSPSTLAKWRLAGTGPPYSKVGRLIVYDIADLDAYLSSRRRLSTSDTGQEG